MDERLKPLIQRAVLDVIEFNYHIRSELNTIGRCNPFYVMSYLKSGEALLRMNGQEYVTTPGSIVLIPPNIVHDHIKTSHEDAVFLWWHFNFLTSWNIDILKLMHLPIVTKVNNTERFESTFMQYLNAINNADSLPGLVYKKAKGLEVLACLFDNIVSSADTKISANVPDVFLNILDDVSKAPKADISLASIAEKYHMNPTYISNRFKEYFGISPIVLHRELLVERAKELLLSGSLNISEISDELGFSDHAVFTRFFSDKVGVSPSKYRNTK